METGWAVGIYDSWCPSLDWPEIPDDTTETNEVFSVDVSEGNTYWDLTVVGITGEIIGSDATVKMMLGNSTLSEYSHLSREGNISTDTVVWSDVDDDQNISVGDTLMVQRPDIAGEYIFEVWYKGHRSVQVPLSL